MAKKHRNLIGKICEPVNLMAAYQATARGRRGTDAYLEFKDYDHINLECLAGDMAAGAYRQGHCGTSRCMSRSRASSALSRFAIASRSMRL